MSSKDNRSEPGILYGGIGCLVLFCLGGLLLLLLFQQSRAVSRTQGATLSPDPAPSEINIQPVVSSTSSVPLPSHTATEPVAAGPAGDAEVIDKGTPVIPDSADPTPTTLPMVTLSPQPWTRTPPEFDSNRALFIFDSGEIWIGVNPDDAWPLSAIGDDGVYTGFEIELAGQIVERMFGPALEIVWIPVPAGEWQEALERDELDVLFSGISHTIGKEESGAFSHNYFLSGARLAVNELSGIDDLREVHGHSLGFVSGTAAEQELMAATQYLGLFWEPLAYDHLADACLDFLNAEVEILVADWLELMACTGGDVDLPIVGDLLTEYGREDGTLGGRPLAAMVAVGDEDFRDELNSVLEEFFEDGTWQEIYELYFGERPWTLEQMIAEPSMDQ